MALLEMKNIYKSFSGVYANENISLTIEKGEIHALLGENGAGKTTLVNILYGLYTYDSGQIIYDGKQVNFKSPKDAILSGIGMVQQHFSLIENMSVLDNIILNLKGNKFFLDRKYAENKIIELSKKYNLKVDPNKKISSLSVGECQRVEILKSLVRDVKLLILDEPTAVLTPQETKDFFKVLKSLKNEGYSILIITHRMSEIMEISDRVTILRDGQKIVDLDTKDTNPKQLSNFMIGRELNTPNYENHSFKNQTVLEINNIKLFKNQNENLNLKIHKGEILGIAGVEGNGQKQLAELITGIIKSNSGSIYLNNQNISNCSVKERYELGISYISDDRLNDSLVTDMDIAENLALREYNKRPFSFKKLISYKAMKKHAYEKINKFQIKYSSKYGPATKVRLLSGGNQQKVIIAREVNDNTKLIVASQPTRGLDIGATEFVHECLIKQRDEEKAIMLISADLEEIISLSDRIAVLFAGKIVGIIDKKDASLEKIGLLMGGITREDV